MSKAKANNNSEEKKDNTVYEDELFFKKKKQDEEIDSDGSASAFDETEQVNEDNFDDLSEK